MWPRKQVGNKASSATRKKKIERNTRCWGRQHKKLQNLHIFSNNQDTSLLWSAHGKCRKNYLLSHLKLLSKLFHGKFQ
uniref:Uncharacterized protein n=1 Tax=Arundo donax TaxID=35708 RepID=A0A0A8XZZ2_ARUDO